MKLRKLIIFLSITIILVSGSATASNLCLENICIGDDVEALDVTWKDIKLGYKEQRSIKALVDSAKIDELYYEYNELLITDLKNKADLAPYIIQLFKFDSKVLQNLKKVKAFCSPVSLTGEVENNSRTKLFVTFRAVADNFGRGKLRVVRLEKEFNIYPPHVRPSDKQKYINMVAALKENYPNIVQVRDIDARAENNEIAFAEALVGFRFFSDVNNPLIFRLVDQAELESIDFDPNRSSLCPKHE